MTLFYALTYLVFGSFNNIMFWFLICFLYFCRYFTTSKFPKEGQQRIKRGKTSQQATAVAAAHRTAAGSTQAFRWYRRGDVVIANTYRQHDKGVSRSAPCFACFRADFFSIYCSFLGRFGSFQGLIKEFLAYV